MTQQEIEKLFKTHYMRMYRLAVSILYDEDESKDVVSEVFSRLITNDIVLRPETTEAYLLMSVRNHCRNVLEHKQVRERFLHLQSEDFCESMSPDAEQLRMTELMQYIETNLPPLGRDIFRLRYLQDMTCQEVADALGVSRMTVHNHLRDAVQRIRTYFKSIQ
ncbi:MAG: sigma-70 family RNA polymerase sigma factor [Bacteroidaceae bacterium]|jgi:RNA polymerase sigma-70 factor (ECF subfamily)|nr:sigma-70 family RNA polymerase sigma factor [Bacteroidaceae bacterium]MBQ2044941.1 sigma-70 family RNA polymerase sigma factor [Bacteroidaceae bacterium]MBQ5656954.1 sigma-70 family RNA polymerase sigma factor [Bacteroidaceae bacterium]